VNKKFRENISEDGMRADTESAGESADTEARRDNGVSYEETDWLGMIREIDLLDGHVEALVYALPDGGIHVQIGQCFATDDLVGFFRWLADGLVPTDGLGGGQATRH
jgi:hypothetical protein